MSRFRKIDPRIWADEKFRRLSQSDKLIALHCLTSAQTNRIGIFYLSPGLAIEQLGMKPDGYAKGMRRVCDTLGWGIDEVVNVLFMPTWWKYNGGVGHLTIRGYLDDLHEVPQTPLQQHFMANRVYLSDRESTELDTLAIPMPRVSAQETETETETEQEQDTETETKPPKAPAPAPPKSKTFQKPTVEEVRAYCLERNKGIDPQQFCDHYDSNGWRVGGKAPMKDWKAAVRTWEKNEYGRGGGNTEPHHGSITAGMDFGLEPDEPKGTK